MSYYGGLFYIAGYMTTYLDSAPEKLSYRFTAPASKTVDKILIRISQVVGISPTYRIGLQGDSGGEPDGSWLSGTAYVDEDTFTPGAWYEADIPDEALTQDTVYHIVVEYVSGTCDGSNHLRIRSYTGAWLKLNPIDATENAAFNVMEYDGADWNLHDKDPIVMLLYDDASYALVPYQGLVGTKNIYLNDYYGEQFTLGENKTISHVGMRVQTNGTPAGDLLLNIYNVTDTVYVIEDEIVDETITGVLGWVDHELDGGPITLTAGKVYQIFYASDDSVDTSNCYQTNGPRTTATYASITFNGTTDAYCATTSGTVPLSALTFLEFAYRLTLYEVPPAGQPYISRVQRVPGMRSWGGIR